MHKQEAPWLHALIYPNGLIITIHILVCNMELLNMSIVQGNWKCQVNSTEMRAAMEFIGKMADGGDGEDEAMLIEVEVPEDSASSRSQCTVCHQSMPVTRLGLIHVHGPMLNR